MISRFIGLQSVEPMRMRPSSSGLALNLDDNINAFIAVGKQEAIKRTWRTSPSAPISQVRDIPIIGPTTTLAIILQNKMVLSQVSSVSICANCTPKRIIAIIGPVLPTNVAQFKKNKGT